MTNKEFYHIYNLLRASFGKYSCWKGNNADLLYPMFEDKDFIKVLGVAQWFIQNSNDAPSVADLLHFKPPKEIGEEQEREIERDKYGCPCVFHTNNEKLDAAIVDFIHFWMDVKHLKAGEGWCAKEIDDMMEYIGEVIKDSYDLDSLADSILEAISNKSLKIEYRRYEKQEKKFCIPTIETILGG